MYKHGIDLRICVNGRPVREYSQKGMVFIESRHGTCYSIKIKNDNASRVMVVVSVDGLDVITGKPAENSNNGYIIDGYSSTEIKGYRISDEKSVDFMFVSKDSKKNYVSQVEAGDKRNSGVIGIRVFEEKPEKVKIIKETKVIEKHIHHGYPVNPWYPYSPSPNWYPMITSTTKINVTGSTISTAYNVSNTGISTGQVASNSSISYTAGGCSTGASYSSTLGDLSRGGHLKARSICSPDISTKVVDNSVSNAFDADIHHDSFDTGTGWGKEKTDIVRKEYFRKGKLVGELVLYYASTDALTDMGIDLTETPKISEARVPKAFGNSEYCQPPKGWNGNK